MGTLKEKYFTDACAEYLKRLTRYCKPEIIQINESNPSNETREIISKCKGHTILCDINGDLISSPDMAQKIANLSQTNSTITFIIGGSDGITPEINAAIRDRFSFGRITLPHQLFRVALLEQIYRAFTINNGEKYHK